jgi:hypothetical protein
MLREKYSATANLALNQKLKRSSPPLSPSTACRRRTITERTLIVVLGDSSELSGWGKYCVEGKITDHLGARGRSSGGVAQGGDLLEATLSNSSYTGNEVIAISAGCRLRSTLSRLADDHGFVPFVLASYAPSGNWRSRCWTSVLVSGCLGRVAKRRQDGPALRVPREPAPIALHTARIGRNQVQQSVSCQAKTATTVAPSACPENLCKPFDNCGAARFRSADKERSLFRRPVRGLKFADCGRGAAATRLGPCRRFCGLRPWCAGGIAHEAQRRVRRLARIFAGQKFEAIEATSGEAVAEGVLGAARLAFRCLGTTAVRGREQLAEHLEAVGFSGAGGGGDVGDGGVDRVVDGLRRLTVPVVRTVRHRVVL